MRRRFNRGERATLYLVGEGRCAACDEPLPAGWHADHRHPFSRGGETAVGNGQALCPACNERKGDRVEGLSTWPAEQALHDWQVDARAAWGASSSDDFLIVATPGSGKTKAALRIASDELHAGRVERVVVVVPTDHLRKQWADAASRVGLEINPDWDNAGPDGAGFCGLVVTYHQVGRSPDLHAFLCRRRTLAIFDEIHHAADTRSWGDALRSAYGPAVRRLLLSGTPFRSDNLTIPFVEYHNGKSAANFTYTYGEALTDQIVRDVQFPNYDGSFAWRAQGELIQAAFRDQVPEEQARQRLRTALDDQGDWLPSVIREADLQLSTVRVAGGHPDAGGLIVCIDQWHAKRVAAIVQRISGESATVVISDDPDASDKIDDFARSGRRWLVAVRMVSEGVDIPRLRVGVYATNIITELYFRQLVGRFVRVTPGATAAEQVAWLYIPSESTIVSYAFAIKKESDIALREAVERSLELVEAIKDDQKQATGEFTPLLAEDAELVDVIISGERLTANDLERARLVKLQAGMASLSDAQVALLLRLGGVGPAVGLAPEAQQATPRTTTPTYRARAQLRAQSARLVNKLVAQTGASHEVINRWLKDQTGAYAGDADLPQLEARIRLLVEQLNGGHDGKREFGG